MYDVVEEEWVESVNEDVNIAVNTAITKNGKYARFSDIEKGQEVIVIKPEKEKYKPELGTKLIRVGFTISGSVRKMVSVSIKGQKISCEYADGWYRFVYKVNPNETRLTIKVLDGGIIGDFNIEIEQGIQGNAKFDI